MCRSGLYSLKHFRMNICTVVRGNKYIEHLNIHASRLHTI